MSDNVHVSIEAKDNTSGAFSSVTGRVAALSGDLAKVGTGALGGITSFAASAVKEVAKIGAAATTVGAGIVSAFALKGLKSNAQFEDYNVQFSTLIKNSDDFKAKYKGVTDALELQKLAAGEAKDEMANLANFAATTPFELPQVVDAARVLRGFGLAAEDTTKRFGQSKDQILAIAGDVASGTGTDFKEIALDIGKFSAGATGEAISRFQELGIVTRNELTQMGLKFSKSGELIVNSQADMDKATGVLLGAMKNKYGGLMNAQSATLNGMLSNMQDWLGATARQISAPLFEPLKTGLQGVLNFVGSDAGKAAVQRLTDNIAKGVDKMGDVFRNGRDAITTFKAALNGQWATGEGINPFVKKIGEFGLALSDFIAKNNLVTMAEQIARVAYAFSPLGTAIAVFQGFITGGATGAIDAFKSRLNDMGSYLGVDLVGIFNNISTFVTSTVVPAFGQIGNFISGTVIPAFQTVIGVIQEFITPISGAVVALAGFGAGAVIIPPILTAIGAGLALVISPIGLIAAAVAGLGAAWATDFGGIRTAVETTFNQTVLPALQRFGDFVTTTVIPAIGQIVTWFGQNVMPALEKFAAFIADPVVPVLGKIASFVLDSVVPALFKIGDIIATMVAPILEGFINFFTTTILPRLTDFVNFIGNNVVPTLTTMVDFFSNNVAPVLKNIAQIVGETVKGAFDLLGKAVSAVADIVSGAFDLAMKGIETVINTVIKAINLLIDGLNLIPFHDHIDKLNEVHLSQDKVKDSTDKMTQSYGSLTGQLSGATKGFVDLIIKANEAGQASGAGLAAGMRGSSGAVAAAGTNMGNVAANSVRSSLKVESPSKVMEAIGVNVADGFISGIANKFGDIGNIANDMGNMIVDRTRKELPTSMFNTGLQATEDFGAGIASGMQASATAFKNATDKVAATTKDTATTFQLIAQTGELSQASIDIYNSNLYRLVNAYAASADGLGPVLLKSATDFATVVSSVASSATAMFAVFAGIAAGSSIAGPAIETFVANMRLVMDGMARAGQEFGPQMMGDANFFAQTINTIGDVIIKILGVFQQIQDSKDKPVTAMAAFITSMTAVDAQMANVAAIAQSVYSKTESFAQKLADAAGKIREGVASIAGINGLSVSANVTVNAASGADVPKLARGTMNWAGGLATFGEAGTELVKMPNMQPFLANQAVTANLPQGTRVYNPSQTQDMLSGRSGSASSAGRDNAATVANTFYITVTGDSNMTEAKVEEIFTAVLERVELERVINQARLGRFS